MIKNIVDTVVAGLILLGSICLWLVADNFPTFEKYKNVDSDFWPKVVLLVIAAASIPVFYQSVRKLLANRNLHKEQTKEPIPQEEVDVKRIIIMATISITYLLIFRTIGFLIATVLFLALSSWLLGIRKKIVLFSFPLLFTTGITLLFVKLLNLPLPRGISVFREFSLFFY